MMDRAREWPVSDLSERLVDSLHATYGAHTGHRAAHAKGVLCHATFTPTTAAARLTTAPHFAADAGSLRAHVRFSNGSGTPTAADNLRDGRGMAVKIYLPDGTTTDVVSLSLPAFFTRTPEDLLAFNEARRADPATGQPDLAKVGAFLAEHPETGAAVTAAITHPIPATYAALEYHALHSFGFVDAAGVRRWGRYHWRPEATDAPLTDEDAAGRADDYLRTELEERLAQGPVRFGLDVQLAAEGDPIDDPTAEWPTDREVVRAGELEITALAFDREQGDDILVFDPTRVAPGIELSADPILLARPGAYAVSVARRTSSRG
jgi:catalase